MKKSRNLGSSSHCLSRKDAQPLVSIVIPSHNHGVYLDEAIQSVLDQDYSNIELLVFDDGSTDDTPHVLEKYTGSFFWETHDNMGQANTLNKGWQMAKGTILSYLSADDVLLPHAVGTSLKYLQANPDVVLTYCDFNLIDPKSHVLRKKRAPDFNYRDMVAKLICHPGPGVFFRRQAFESAGLWNGSLRQMPDYEYWLRLGLTGRFLRIPEVLASFRVHTQSQSFAKSDMRKSEEPPYIISDFFQRQGIPVEIMAAKNEALSTAHLVGAHYHFRSGRYQLGFLSFKRAISLYPSHLLTRRTARLMMSALFSRLFYRLLWRVGNS